MDRWLGMVLGFGGGLGVGSSVDCGQLGVGLVDRWLWTQGVLESPPSFCNGLGIIYIASFQGRTFDLTTRVWVRSLSTLLGRC